MKTKIFCDIADFKTIKNFNNKSIVDGFTTNPSLMRLAGAKNYKDYSLKILKVCKKKPISFEVFADNLNDMLKQAYEINSWGKNVYVKIPIVNSKGIFMGSVIKELSNKGIKLNRTNNLINEIEYLFAEDQGRYIVEVNPKNLKEVKKILNDNSVYHEELGVIIEKDMIINAKTKVTIDELKSYNSNWLTNFMSA